ncbi:MAG TPA: hypothetical protein VI814_07485 [Candidatus Limnocylindria bacterium]
MDAMVERHTVRGVRAAPTLRVARIFVWAMWTVSAFFIGVAFLLILATISVDTPSRGFGFRGWVPLVAALWVTIGARIAARQPRLSVGWLIFAVGWLWSVNALFEEYATYAYFPQEQGLPLVPQAVWFNAMVGTAVAGLSGVAILVVPDGRLPSRRWVVLEVAIVAFTFFAVVTMAVLPRRLVPFPFENPFGIESLRAYEASFPALLRSFDVGRGLEVLLPTAALLLRLRRAVGAERQQLKLVAAATSFASVTVFVYAFFGDPVVQYAQILGLILVPAAFGLAMRRYRLYEIDQILGRTFVLGGATALLAGVYTASIGLMQRIFIVLTGERSDAAVVLTTLLVAAAFAPLRDRLQAVVKRMFGADLPGTHGLDVFTDEIDAHLRLSDRDRLLSQLLAESVGSLGSTCGVLEIMDEGAAHPTHAIGAWKGDTHLSVDVIERGEVAARVCLGPRANGEGYDEDARRRLERAATVVGLALDRLGRPGAFSAVSGI